MFVDRAVINVKGGSGGNGCISFRREKYVPKGGPDGGNGGKGGSVYFVGSHNLHTLMDFRGKKNYKAESGGLGQGKNRNGKNGADLFVEIPVGTIIRDLATGRVIADITKDEQKIAIVKGGKGGRGNAFFKGPENQAPKYAEPGQPGKKLEIELELKLIADVGLIGYPNAGKSTFLSVVTSATPKIADYPFTTLKPNLGVATVFEQQIVIADIPGLIEGASQGKGLGTEFLKHVQRTKMLIHIIDGTQTDLLDRFNGINKELEDFDPDLAGRPQLVALNKTEIAENLEEWDQVEKELEKKSYQVFRISAVTKQGLDELMQAVHEKLLEIENNSKEESF